MIDDQMLRARFQALRRQDATRTPDFERVLRQPQRQRDALWLSLAGTIAVASVVATVWLWVGQITLEPEQTALPAWPLATASLTDVVAPPAAAFERLVPSDALYRFEQSESKEQP